MNREDLIDARAMIVAEHLKSYRAQVEAEPIMSDAKAATHAYRHARKLATAITDDDARIARVAKGQHMAKRRNTKAEILADIERVRMEKAAAREEARRLIELGADAKVVEETGEDGRKHHVVRARHLDCFALLLKGDAFVQARASVDWLEALIRDASGENAQERRPDHIRASTVGAPGQNVTQRMIEASRELEVVEANLRPWEARLLFELLKPDAARLGRWHDVAKRVTGEVNAQAQGAAVRLAAQNLQWVETRMPTLMREYWERKAA